MKILFCSLGLLLLLVYSSMRVAMAGGRVAYTWSWVDFGQGVHGGGPLFADGSAGGNVHFSGDDGNIIFDLDAETWAPVVPGESIDICFKKQEVKGSFPFLPEEFCLTDIPWLGPLPVTGTPFFIDLDQDGHADLLIRVTPVR